MEKIIIGKLDSRPEIYPRKLDFTDLKIQVERMVGEASERLKKLEPEEIIEKLQEIRKYYIPTVVLGKYLLAHFEEYKTDFLTWWLDFAECLFYFENDRIIFDHHPDAIIRFRKSIVPDFRVDEMFSIAGFRAYVDAITQ